MALASTSVHLRDSLLKIIDRYIAYHVLIGSLTALVIFVGIDLVFAFATESSDIGQGDYSLFDALLYVLLTAPRRAYEIMPMASVVGSMMILSGLARQNEFVVMRSAGVTTKQLITAVMKGGGVLAVLIVLLSEAVIPFSELYAQQMRTLALTQNTALKSTYGIWIRDGLRFVNIANVLPDGQLSQLDIYELDSTQQLRMVLHAEQAVFTGDQWQLYGVDQSVLTQDRIYRDRHEVMDWPALLRPKFLHSLSVTPDQLSIWQLRGYIDHLRKNDLQTQPYEFAYWGKVLAPFSLLLMLLISVPLVVVVRNGFSSLGPRILFGIVIGAGYLMVLQLIVKVGQVGHFNAFLVNVIPVASLLVAIIISLRRTR